MGGRESGRLNRRKRWRREKESREIRVVVLRDDRVGHECSCAGLDG